MARRPGTKKGRPHDGKVPKYADVLKKRPPRVFWENPKVIKLVTMAVFEKSRSVGEVCQILGVTPEMIFAKVAKDKDQDIARKPKALITPMSGEVVRTSSRLQIKKRHRLNFVSYSEFLERKMGSKKEFWEQPFVISKLVEVKRNQTSTGRASELLGVTHSMLRYHLAKKGLHISSPKVDHAITKRYEKHIVKGKKKTSKESHSELDSTVKSNKSSEEEDEENKISLYESIRLKNIEEKKAMLKQLGFCSEEKSNVKSRRSLPRKKKLPAPRDKSLRILKKQKDAKKVSGDFVPEIEEFQVPPVPQMNLEDFLSIGQDFRKCYETLNEVKNSVNFIGDQNNNWSDVLEVPDLFSVKYLGQVTRSKILTLDVYPDANLNLVGAGDVRGEVGLWFGDEDGNCVSLQPHSKSVNCLQFNPWNPPQTLTSGNDGFLRSLDLSSQKLEIVYQWDQFPGFHEQEKSIGWHLVTSPSQVVLCHRHSGRIYQFDPRSGRRSFLMNGNGSKISVDVNNPSVMCVPSDKKVVIADDRYLKTFVKEIPSSYQPKSAFFSKDSRRLLISLMSEKKCFVQVHDLRGNLASTNREWEAKICPHFEHGAVWHPDEQNIAFFPINGNCDARSRTEKRLGIGVSLVAMNTEIGKIMKNFAEVFTEKNFGIVASQTKAQVYFPDGCGRGSVCMMKNVC